jgi:hypothetical protein
MESRGEIRPQFHHVIDVAPTVLEAAGLPEPVGVNGVQQMPLQGVGMAYSFDDPDAPDRHETQYFEMFANRGIYHKGWTAVTRHSIPWTMAVEMPPFDDEVWELYGPEDWNQAHDLSGEMPEKLHELQRLFLIEAVRYNVLPLDDRRVERFNADLAGRPQLIHGTSQLLFRGMGRLSENSVLVIKNKSHSVTAQIVVPDAGASGVIIAQVGEGRVEATVPMVFSGDETCDVGSESGTPVSDDYDARGNQFSGHIGWVQIDLGEDAEDADHLISPQERLQLAMARQ